MRFQHPCRRESTGIRARAVRELAIRKDHRAVTLQSARHPPRTSAPPHETRRIPRTITTLAHASQSAHAAVRAASEDSMTILASATALGVAVYLLIALLQPERFS
jgi:K+-transporting ATPase KdpF subunit